MLILNVATLMNVGYEKAFLMQNNMNTTVSELISTYVYKVGLQQRSTALPRRSACLTRSATSSCWLS